MAGIAAARVLRERGLDVVVIEAAPRVGGRALTVTSPRGGVFDCGAGWLHSWNTNPLTQLATESGFHVERLALRELVWLDGSGFLSPDQLADWRAYREHAYGEICRAAAMGQDTAVAGVLGGGNAMFRRVLQGWFSDDEGTRLESASTADIAAYLDTGEHARVAEGLGTLVRRSAEGLPIHCGVRAQALDWSGPHVKVSSTEGRVEARAAIVTVSTTLLARGDILFKPRLPSETQAAIQGLPLAVYEKVALYLEGPPLLEEPAWVLALAEPDLTVAFEVRPELQPRIVAYLSGPALALRPRPDLGAIALDRLAATFGAAARRAAAQHATSWSTDRLIGGSYSYALPGRAGARAALSTPLEERVFFAGEACSQTAYGTLHGAYMSGRATALRVAETLG
jgi:monoamine oxidase